jgi:hypothetical protein
MRFVKGITLTPEERQQAGYAGGHRNALLHTHTAEITLPDGRSCNVDYRRHGPGWHEFTFGLPLARRSYSSNRLESSPECILATAIELGAAAFRAAQCAEQQGMQRKSRPKGWTDPLPAEAPRLKAPHAAELAGLYAVCVRLASGALFPCGSAHPEVTAAVQNLTDGRYAHPGLLNGQRLVIGICCRFARRWYEAEFVPLPHTTPEPDPPEPSVVPQPAQAF